jgi:hypothetical protein
MLGVDPEFGTSMLRLWIAAGSAVLLVLFCVLAVFQSQLRMAASPVRRAGVVVAGAILGAVIVWAVLDRPASRDSDAERRSLEMRAQDLNTHALAPGSPLACLDALAGESVEAACEKALFVSPASVAAASSYVAAGLALLSNAERDGGNIDEVLSPLRHALEADRFGFVAHVLAIRDGCTSQNCKALALLRDSGRVRANLSEHTLDRYLERYASTWSAATDAPIADAIQPPSGASGAPGAHKMVNIDFPSAASIPAVSIMNPEPTGPVLPGAAAAAASNPNPAAAAQGPSRHAHKQAAAPAPATPVQPAISGSTAADPIWPEPVPPPPPASPSQSSAAPPTGTPVQLNPSSANASSGVAAHAQ